MKSVPKFMQGAFRGGLRVLDQCSKIGTGCSPPVSSLEGISAVATNDVAQATTWRSNSEETVGGTSGVVRKG